jgi:hypothetical protein
LLKSLAGLPDGEFDAPPTIKNNGRSASAAFIANDLIPFRPHTKREDRCTREL